MCVYNMTRACACDLMYAGKPVHVCYSRVIYVTRARRTYYSFPSATAGERTATATTYNLPIMYMYVYVLEDGGSSPVALGGGGGGAAAAAALIGGKYDCAHAGLSPDSEDVYTRD